MTNTSESTIKYFGFGANATVEMMDAICGYTEKDEMSFTKRNQIKTELTGYELCYKKLEDLDENETQGILRATWDEKPENSFPFESYFIRKQKEGETKKYSVWGTLWSLTPEEYELVNVWELVNGRKEGQEIKGSMRPDEGMQDEVKIKGVIYTQALEDGSEKAHPVEERHQKSEWPYYNEFLGGEKFKKHILETARKSREEYLKREGREVTEAKKPIKIPGPKMMR
jgi:hypothetical protein